MKPPLTIREFPAASFEPLRVQVGTIEHRRVLAPIYDARRVLTTYRASDEVAEVFHLRYFASTVQEAKKRAGMPAENALPGA
jgi:hypothetical protein